MKGIIGEVRRMGSRGHCLTLLRVREVRMGDGHPCLLSSKMSHSHTIRLAVSIIRKRDAT